MKLNEYYSQMNWREEQLVSPLFPERKRSHIFKYPCYKLNKVFVYHGKYGLEFGNTEELMFVNRLEPKYFKKRVEK